MKSSLLVVASVAFLVVCSVSSFGQAAKPQQVTPENPKTRDEALGESGKAEEDARKSKRTVTLQAIFRASGIVEVVKVLEVTPKDLPKEVADDLVKKCIEAAKRIKFEPAMKDGRPASQHVRIEYFFSNEEKTDKQK
jgi:hypothetical protein